VKIGYLGGLIQKSQKFGLQRQIFRVLRGKASVHMFDIPPEESDHLCDFSSDSVFIVIYQHGDFAYR
jgi:hypothetical protein